MAATRDERTLPKNVADALGQLFQNAQAVYAEFAHKLEAEPTPNVIYHYTDARGLRGILETGKLWFTDIFYLNDPTELRHSLSFAVDFLRKEAAKGSPALKLFLEHLGTMLSRDIEEIAHFFVCSFSKSSDELGQWRAYADDGRGFAIGFDGKALEEAFAKIKGKLVPGHITFPVTYDDTVLQSMQERIIAKVDDVISRAQGRDLSNDIVENLLHQLVAGLALPLIQTGSIRLTYHASL